MAQTRGLRARQFQAITLVIVPTAKIDGIARPPALGHAQHVDEEREALFRLRGQQFEMSEMSDVHDRFVGHDVSSAYCCPKSAKLYPEPRGFVSWRVRLSP